MTRHYDVIIWTLLFCSMCHSGYLLQCHRIKSCSGKEESLRYFFIQSCLSSHEFTKKKQVLEDFAFILFLLSICLLNIKISSILSLIVSGRNLGSYYNLKGKCPSQRNSRVLSMVFHGTPRHIWRMVINSSHFFIWNEIVQQPCSMIDMTLHFRNGFFCF